MALWSNSVHVVYSILVSACFNTAFKIVILVYIRSKMSLSPSRYTAKVMSIIKVCQCNNG